MNPTVTATSQNSDGTWANTLSNGDKITSANPQSAYAIGSITAGAVPTKAPSAGSPDTSASPLVPTPIVSSSTASNNLNNVVIPGMKQAQQDLTTHQQNVAQNTANINANNQAPAPTNPNTNQQLPNTSTPEERLLNTPEVGHKFIYATDGTRSEVPVTSAVPMGFTDTIPQPKPTLGAPLPQNANPTNSVSLGGGRSIVQLPDGTYGYIDQNNNYVGTANLFAFQDAQKTKNASDALDSVANGTAPLRPEQKAQIDALKTAYDGYVAKQEQANSNLTGVMRMQQNLAGLGDNVVGQGAVAETITNGISKVAALQSELASKIGSMTEAFQKGNYTDLKGEYDKYVTAQKDITTTIDDLSKKLTTAKRQQSIDMAIADSITSGVTDPAQIAKNLAAKGIIATSKEINDSMDNLSPDQKARADLMKTAKNNNAPSDVLQKMGSSRNLTDMYIASGVYGKGGTGVVAEYNAYVGQATSKGIAPLDILSWSKSKAEAVSSGTAQGKASVISSTALGAQSFNMTGAAAKNNNPGNLEFINQAGAVQGAPRYDKKGNITSYWAKFETPADGFNAMVNDLQAKISGNTTAKIPDGPNINKTLSPSSTLQDLIRVYAPTSDNNDPVGYAKQVAKELGVSDMSPLSSIDPNKLAIAMARREGTTITTMGEPDLNVDPNKPQANLYGLSFNDLKAKANTVNANGGKAVSSVVPGRGNDAETKGQRNAVTNYAAMLSNGNPVIIGALKEAQQKELNLIQTRTAPMQSAKLGADANLDTALQAYNALGPDASSKVTHTSVPFINNILNKYSNNFADAPGLTDLEVKIYTAVREYAKLASGSTGSVAGLTKSATDEAEALLNGAKSPESFAAAVGAMKTDMNNLINAQNQTVNDAQDTMKYMFQSKDPVVASQQDKQSALKNASAKSPEFADALTAMINYNKANNKPDDYQKMYDALKARTKFSQYLQ